LRGLISDKLAQAIGQPVIFDNRPGAVGMMDAEAASATAGDGYNLFYSVKAVSAIAPHGSPTAITTSCATSRPSASCCWCRRC